MMRSFVCRARVSVETSRRAGFSGDGFPSAAFHRVFQEPFEPSNDSLPEYQF